MKDYYEILGVSKDADEKEIKTAYRKLSLQHHPDRNQGNKDAEEKFKEVNEAYQILSDPDKKQNYDLGGNTDSNFDAREHINDILRSMGFGININDFTSNPFGHSTNSKIQFKHQIAISLRDAIFGCEVETDVPSYPICKDCNGDGGKKIKCAPCNGAGQTLTFLGTMQIPVTCVSCNGKGNVLSSTCSTCNREGHKKKMRHIKVKIPVGIQHQTLLHIGSEPNDRSDIFLVINVRQHPKINRNGSILYSTENISCLDAMIGGEKIIETIDGKYTLTIPPYTQHGQQLVIEDHGVFSGVKRGNHIVQINIDIPKKLTVEQIALIKKLKEEVKDE